MATILEHSVNGEYVGAQVVELPFKLWLRFLFWQNYHE